MVAVARLGLSLSRRTTAYSMLAVALTFSVLCAGATLRQPSSTASSQQQTANAHALPIPTGRQTSSWSAIPLAARGAISTALGHDDHAYQLHGLTLTNPAQALSAHFVTGAVAVSSGKLRFRLSISGLGRDQGSQPVIASLPIRSGQRVVYQHAGLTESWTNGPYGLEQNFRVLNRPAGSGPLQIALAVSGTGVRLGAATTTTAYGSSKSRNGAQSVSITGHGHTLNYDGLLVTDAGGRTVRSWLTVHGSRIVIHVDDRGARYPLRVDPYVQQNELTSSDGAAYDGLGNSIAISGSTIAIGAFGHTVAGNVDQGAVYVFTEPASGWAHAAQVAELTSSDGAKFDYFGESVAISGQTIVVGAYCHAVNGHNDQGAAYVFTRPPSGWRNMTQTAELTSSDGAGDDYFGYSVAISGNTIVSGAYGHTVNGHTDQGAAYVFTEPTSGWTNATQTAELISFDGVGDDNFGCSVAISGNTIVVGARFHKANGNALQGAAYVYTEPASGWANMTQTAELTSSDGAKDDYFGNSVAISGNTIVVGAKYQTVNGNALQGAAYVYTKPASGWTNTTQTAELISFDGVAHDLFGYSVAISGNTIVVGGYDHTVNGNTDQGAAYVFTKPPSGWANMAQTAELTSSDGAADDLFGYSVAIAGNTTVVGAYLHQVGSNTDQGTAYLFTHPAATALSGQLRGGGKHGSRITVKPKASVRFFANLTGADASTATGTITYNLYKNHTCTRLFKHWQAQKIATVGTIPASKPIKLSKPGTYYWQATYTGDQTNTGSKTRCGTITATIKQPRHQR